MNRSTRFFKSLVAAAVLALPALGATGCSDDPAAPAPPDGTSEVTFFSANPGYFGTADLRFSRSGTVVATTPYGDDEEATLTNGSSTFNVLAADGSDLGSTTVALDSGQRFAIFFTGTASSKDIYSVNTPTRTPASGNAAVRFINASANVGNIDVKVNSVNGLEFTSNLAYKSGTVYKDLPVLTLSSLIVTRNGDTTSLVTVPITPLQIADGNRYAIVVYGSADTNAQAGARLMARIVQE